MGALQRDSFEADWTACDMSGDPVHRSEVKAPTRTTIYEEPALPVVGWRMPTYWRPSLQRCASATAWRRGCISSRCG